MNKRANRHARSAIIRIGRGHIDSRRDRVNSNRAGRNRSNGGRNSRRGQAIRGQSKNKTMAVDSRAGGAINQKISACRAARG